MSGIYVDIGAVICKRGKKRMVDNINRLIFKLSNILNRRFGDINILHVYDSTQGISNIDIRNRRIQTDAHKDTVCNKHLRGNNYLESESSKGSAGAAAELVLRF